MGKKLIDYAHLYSGGKLLLDSRYYDGVVCGVTDAKLLEIIAGMQHRLVLRNIMDMTEQEAREFFGEVMHFHRQLNLHYQEGWWRKSEGYISIQDNRNVSGEWLLIIKPSGEPNVPCFNCTYSMSEVIWLLKKGFDLFGLLAAGLAVTPEYLKENGIK